MSLAPDADARMRRNLPLLTGYMFILGLRVYLPGYVVFYHQMGLSAARTGLVWAVVSITVIASDGLTGLIADRYGYRRSLMLGAALLASAFLGIFWAPSIPNKFWWLVACHILLGLGTTFAYSSTPQAFGGKSAERHGVYASFAGKSIGSMYLASALAAGMALATVKTWPQSGARLLWLVQVSFTCALFVVASRTVDPKELRVPKPKLKREREPNRSYERLCWVLSLNEMRLRCKKSLNELRGNWPVFSLLLPLILAAMAAESSVFVSQIYCSTRSLGLTWSVAIAASGFTIMAPVSTRVPVWLARFGLPRLAMATAILVVMSYAAASVLPGRWQAVAVVAMFVPSSIPFTAAATYLNLHVSGYRATVGSLYTTAKSICIAGFLPLFGWLVDAYSFNLACFIWAGGFSVVFAGAAALIYRPAGAAPTTIPNESPPS